jgi:hypothetical protein
VHAEEEFLLRQKGSIPISVAVKCLFALNGHQIPAQGKLVFERRPGIRSNKIMGCPEEQRREGIFFGKTRVRTKSCATEWPSSVTQCSLKPAIIASEKTPMQWHVTQYRLEKSFTALPEGARQPVSFDRKTKHFSE